MGLDKRSNTVTVSNILVTISKSNGTYAAKIEESIMTMTKLATWRVVRKGVLSQSKREYLHTSYLVD